MSPFFHLYERLRDLRYLAFAAALVLVLALLSHPVTYLIAGILVIAWAVFWPLCVNDCFVTNGNHLPEDYNIRLAYYSLPLATHALYAFITWLAANYDIGLFTPDDISPHKLNLVIAWYMGITLAATIGHMIACTELTYKRILKGLK